MWLSLLGAVTRYARRFRRIARRLDRLELMARSMDEDPLRVDPRELIASGGTRFLDFYGEHGIRVALDKYGLLAALGRRGYRDIEVRTRSDDGRHTLLVDGRHDDLPDAERLIELVVRRDRLVAPEGVHEVLTIDWLTLRNPAASFQPERPRLPGQDAPGLGLGERVLELLYRVVERLRLDGLLTVAEYFHNAVLYRRELSFWEPRDAAHCVALEQTLMEREGLTLAQASWAMEWNLVRDVSGAHPWSGSAQVRGMRGGLEARFKDPTRKASIAEALRTFDFALDRPRFEERWAASDVAP